MVLTVRPWSPNFGTRIAYNIMRTTNCLKMTGDSLVNCSYQNSVKWQLQSSLLSDSDEEALKAMCWKQLEGFKSKMQIVDAIGSALNPLDTS